MAANPRPATEKPIVLSHLHLILLVALSTLLITTLVAVVSLIFLNLDIPGISALRHYQPPVTSEIYDRHNNLCARVFEENRYLIPLAQMPRLAAGNCWPWATRFG